MVLTGNAIFANINVALGLSKRLERYRSGHNEAVLKTVCPQGRMGSNPILSVGDDSSREMFWRFVPNNKNAAYDGKGNRMFPAEEFLKKILRDSGRWRSTQAG